VSIPREAFRAPDDVIPPENHARAMLDRDITVPDSTFAQVFGPEDTPVQSALYRQQALGRVALFDVGCGTGNTLRTWMEAVREHSEPSDVVTAAGITLHDYSGESALPQTAEAVKNDLTYIVGNAESMPEVPSESADVLLAFMSLVHMTSPELALREMVRIARPGAVMYMNAIYEEWEKETTPFREALTKLPHNGCAVEVRRAMIAGPDGQPPLKLAIVKIEKRVTLDARWLLRHILPA